MRLALIQFVAKAFVKSIKEWFLQRLLNINNQWWIILWSIPRKNELNNRCLWPKQIKNNVQCKAGFTKYAGFFVRAKTNGRWSFGPPMSTWIMVYGKSAIIDMKKRGILSTDKGNCYSIWQTRMAIKTGRHRETWLVKLIFVLRVAVSGVKQITYYTWLWSTLDLKRTISINS